jgi:hypothetical protein
MRKRLWLILSIAFSALHAGDSAIDRATLRGIKAVNVVIDPLSTKLQDSGLSQDMLRKEVESHLKQAGIEVDPNAVEFLGLRVDSIAAGKGLESFNFSLGFYQRVTLNRDQSIKTATQTWDVNSMLVAARKPLVSAAVSTAGQLADQFVIAYRSVNQAQ